MNHHPDPGESSNDCYSSNQPLSNSVQGTNGLEHISQFTSLNEAFTQNMINLSQLQDFARQQQQQQQNLFRASLSTPLSQNQTSAQSFSYYQQAHQALHEPDPLPPTQQTLSSSKNKNSALSDRSKFVVFVKVLLRYMDKLSDERLTQRTKHAIAECTRLHRNGALGYTSLSDALEFRLRSVIGDDHWNRAYNYCTYLMERKERDPEEKMASAV